MKICIVTGHVPPVRCGVGDHSIQLAMALVARGDDVCLLTTRDQAGTVEGADVLIRNALPSWGPRGMPVFWREIRAARPDVILLQWVPFLYSRTGTNVSLPATIAALAARGYAVHVMVHEPWVPFNWWSYFLTGPVQRLVLGVLVSASRRTSASITPWRDLLQSRFPWRRARIDWVPVGSNIHVAAASRAAVRDAAGIPHQSLIVAVFSLHGTAKGFAFIERAWRDLARADETSHLVLIGVDATEASRCLPEASRHARCRVTGPLSAADVSAWLQATDMMLAPFTDGMNSRRTSALAGLAHGVPIVSTRGRLTDPRLFADAPLVLSDMDEAAFSREALALAGDEPRRRKLATEAPTFYARNFSWEEIAERLLPRARAPLPAAPAMRDQPAPAGTRPR